MKDDVILWTGSMSEGWPKKPPVLKRRKSSGLWSYWVELKKTKDDGEPIAAMLAIDTYIREGEIVPPALAQWFNDSFDLYWSDTQSKAKNRISLDVAFGFTNTRGEGDALAAYKDENRRVLGTMHLLIKKFGLQKSVSARSAISYHKVEKTEKWIIEAYTQRCRSGAMDRGQFWGSNLPCYFDILNIDSAISNSNDRRKLNRAAENFRVEHLGGAPKEQLIEWGTEAGYLNNSP